MITGNGTLSLRKKDLENQKVPAIGFKKTVFAHKATAGQTGINLTALTTPTELTANGYVQPSVADLAAAQLLFYRNNLKLVSSARGVLIDFISYTVASSTQINFLGFTALEGEIFYGIIDYTAVTGVKVVDASPIIATGTLAATLTDFNVGTPFAVNKYPAMNIGAVLVYVDRVLQQRNTSNSSTVKDKDYYEVDAGNGLGTIIRFNLADPDNAREITVVSNGLLAERPDGSMMAVIEALAGYVDNITDVVAQLSGLSEANVKGAAPTNVDLKNFGDKVYDLEQTRARKDQSNTWTAPQPLVGATDGSSPASDQIGYRIVANLTTNPITTAGDTYVDAGGTLTIPAGHWMVGYCVTAGLSKTASLASVGINAELVMRDNGDNAVVTDMRTYLEVQGPVSTIAGNYSTASRMTFLNLTAPKTVKMSIRCAQATVNGQAQILGTADITGGLSGSDNSSTMWCVRIK